MAIGIIADSIQNTRTLKVAHNAIVASDEVIVSNGNVLVAVNAAPANQLNSYVYMGKVILPKVAPLAIGALDRVYWDASAGKITKTASGNTPCGICIEAAGSADTEVVVYLFPNANAFPVPGSHYTFAAGVFTTAAGNANQTITVASMLTTDIAFAILAEKGATPRTILTAIAAAGQINVLMSGDPSTDHKIAYQVLRPVS